jgi:choline dehydrogenase-like flavoprotein
MHPSETQYRYLSSSNASYHFAHVMVEPYASQAQSVDNHTLSRVQMQAEFKSL